MTTSIFLWEGLWEDLRLLTVVWFSSCKIIGCIISSLLVIFALFVILQVLLLLVLHVFRLFFPLGCFSEASLSVSQLWKRLEWKRWHEEADIITWSWIWYNIFPVAGAWVSSWFMANFAQGCSHWLAAHMFLCFALLVLDFHRCDDDISLSGFVWMGNKMLNFFFIGGGIDSIGIREKLLEFVKKDLWVCEKKFQNIFVPAKHRLRFRRLIFLAPLYGCGCHNALYNSFKNLSSHIYGMVSLLKKIQFVNQSVSQEFFVCCVIEILIWILIFCMAGWGESTISICGIGFQGGASLTHSLFNL